MSRFIPLSNTKDYILDVFVRRFNDEDYILVTKQELQEYLRDFIEEYEIMKYEKRKNKKQK